LQRAVMRGFIAAGSEAPTNIFLDFAYGRKRLARKRLSQAERYSLWRVLMKVATPIGRASTIGRPWLWRLNDELGKRWRWKHRGSCISIYR